MKEKIKDIRYLIWGIVSLLGIICGITDAIFYNILIFPIIGILTFTFFPQTYLKWIGGLLVVNYLISVVVFFFGIQGNFIGALLTGLIYAGLYMVLSSVGMMILYLFRKLFDQKSTNAMRTLSGVVATALLVFILQFSMSTVGNPITAMRANSAIEEYVEQKFDYDSLVVSRVRYDRMTAEYISRVYSKTEVDLHFEVIYVSGRGVVSDTYELDVLRFRNTINRLADEYTQLIQNLMRNELPLKNNRTKVWYDLDSLEIRPDVLSLGMEFDVNLPLSVGVFLDFEMKGDALSEIADIVQQAYALFEQNGFHFDSYSVSVTAPTFSAMIEGITPPDIENGTLSQLLEGDIDENRPSHISIEVTSR